jgi:hypothetical protein
VREVREFIRQEFGDDPDPDVPVLLASELATNSVLFCTAGRDWAAP